MALSGTRTALLWACALGLLGIALAASAHDRGAGSSSERSELAVGQYHCGLSFDPGEVSAYYSLETSGDLFARSPVLYRSQAVAAPSPGICQGLAEAAAGGLTRGGCAVGSVEGRDDEGGSERSFSFVCRGPRSDLVALLAEALASHLTAPL